MRKIVIILLSIGMVLSLTACHKHIPAAEPTCAGPQVCRECDKVLAEPLAHTPGAEPTCTTPQICTVCKEVLKDAIGHDPGPAATCTESQICLRCGVTIAEKIEHTPDGPASCTKDQICTVCGEVIAKAEGHEIGSDGVCAVCGEQVVPSGQQYVSPGAHVETSADVIPETQNSGHYNNNIDAYYANAVLVCGDYGIEYFSPDPTGSSSYANTVNAFASKYPQLNVTCMLVPKCAAFESPKGYDDPYEATKSFIESTYAMMDPSIKKADCMGVMTQHDGEYMFYRTDHHWTSLGAYYGSVAYCQANGITCRDLSSYDTVINTGYNGSLYMYGGYPAALKQNPDYTVGHMPATGYSMVYYRDGYRYNGTAINESSSSYAGMFICGDQPLTVITTDNKNGKTLIVFKESYGNAFVPYMIDYYEQVIVVDIREETDSVANIISQYNVTDALIINNVQGALSLRSNLEKKALS